MAGITSYPFRRLCRSFGSALFVGEMVAARQFVLGAAKARRLATFGPDERPRSLQLYGVEPGEVGEAVRRLAGEEGVDHLDLNFGCPVPKIMRKGGGAAVPARPELLRSIVKAAVEAAGRVPVTIKMRMGLDDRRLTSLEAGHIAEEEGCAGVILHARTAEQLYDGDARWEAIAELKSRLRTIPVLGNGDLWRAQDALRMIQVTGCDGVVIGRGCLGRPWIFRDLTAAFQGLPAAKPPTLGETADIMLEHARLLADWHGDEEASMRAFRKHVVWYVRGYRQAGSIRSRIASLSRLSELEDALEGVDKGEEFPADSYRLRPDKRKGRQRVRLPQGFCAEGDM